MEAIITKRDILIPKGTVMMAAPEKTIRVSPHFQSLVGLSNNTCGYFEYPFDEYDDYDKELVDWFGDVDNIVGLKAIDDSGYVLSQITFGESINASAKIKTIIEYNEKYVYDKVQIIWKDSYEDKILALGRFISSEEWNILKKKKLGRSNLKLNDARTITDILTDDERALLLYSILSGEIDLDG